MQKALGSTNLWESIETSLLRHVKALTEEIGERSVGCPENLGRAAEYIRGAYDEIGLPAALETYVYRGFPVGNVVSEIRFREKPARRYLLGAHYDTVRGCVGADDNASGVAVQLETARILRSLSGVIQPDVAVECVAFTLEEQPAFWSPYRGSWVYARQARKAGKQIDGMLCLEMVGYRSAEPGSQKYPFPLMYLDYPGVGNFIGIVGDSRSASLTRSVQAAFAMQPSIPTQTLTVPLKGWLTPFVRRSDHVSFWDTGYQAVMLTDTAEYRNPHYHKHTDTWEKLDYSFMADLVRSLVCFFTEADPHAETTGNEH